MDDDPAFAQAGALRQQGNYAAAAAQYAELAARLPDSGQAQKASMLAGFCFAAAGSHADAIVSYDKALAVGLRLIKPEFVNPRGLDEETPKGRLTGKRLRTVRDWMENALYNKALACQQVGDPAMGLRTIQQLRAEFPNSRYITRLVPAQAAFERRPPEDAPILVQREMEAAQTGDQAHAAFCDSKHDDALPLLDYVITHYPETAAALRARGDKARILWGRGKYDEARAAFAQILDLTQAAPDSELARTAQYRIAWLDAGRMLTGLIDQRKNAQTVSDDQWERARDMFRVVTEKAQDPGERAQGHVNIIESYCWQGRPEQTAEAAKYFFRNYGGGSGKKAQKFKRQLAWAHVFAGDAAHKLGRYDEALAHFRLVLQAHQGEPENWRGEGTLCTLYWRIWYTGRKAGATAEAEEAAKVLLSQYAQSKHADFVRRARAKEVASDAL
jgi:tetratricopeptide (TPR) repeat protein